MRSATLAGRTILTALLTVAAAGVAAAQTGRAGGLVSDETGEPIKGATVRAENPLGEPKSFTASTDPKGRFVIIGLRPGDWTFTAEAPGFESRAASLRVQAQGLPTRPLLFTLPKSFGGPVAALGSVAPKDLQAALAEADQLFADQRWAEAQSAYLQILERTPALSSVHLQIAAIERQRHDYDGAIETYQTLLRLEPANGDALVGLAMTHVEQGDPDAGEALLLKASDATPPNRNVLEALGDIRASRGDAAGAASWYERAANADPYWSKPVFQLGRLAMDRGETDRATGLMQKVLAIDPLSPEAAQAQLALSRLQP
jgi:Tfp pilus assembly protein PilF